MNRLFAILGPVVLAFFAYANYTGFGLTSYDEVKDVPRSIRNNPGVYRSVYARYPHK
jgi:hypothetical protein